MGKKGVSSAKLFDAATFVTGSGNSRNLVSGATARMVLKASINRNNKEKSNNNRRSRYLRRNNQIAKS